MLFFSNKIKYLQNFSIRYYLEERVVLLLIITKNNSIVQKQVSTGCHVTEKASFVFQVSGKSNPVSIWHES